MVDGLPLRVPPDGHPDGPAHVGIRSERVILRRIDPTGELPENCMVATIVEVGVGYLLTVVGLVSLAAMTGATG